MALRLCQNSGQGRIEPVLDSAGLAVSEPRRYPHSTEPENGLCAFPSPTRLFSVVDSTHGQSSNNTDGPRGVGWKVPTLRNVLLLFGASGHRLCGPAGR